MKAFISYSHGNTGILLMLHKHLAQLKRDQLIHTWTDEDIAAGTQLNSAISSALAKAQLFIALLSPEYINSNYCYDKEFQKALEMQKEGKLVIIPIIIEPCDWLNTPFRDFKALPKDGKPISEWSNANTAFLDIVQNIRKLITMPENAITKEATAELNKETIVFSKRNYRIKKDFDSIEKSEFIEKSFQELKGYIEKFLLEIVEVDNIKSRTYTNNAEEFACLLINRNKIATEAKLEISIKAENPNYSAYRGNSYDFKYSITVDGNPSIKGYSLAFDDFHLFWTESSTFYNRTNKEISLKDIADKIWEEWLESVGIMFK